MILFCETDRVEFESPASGAETLPCRYAVGVLDESSGKLHLQEAPVFHMNRTIKALKNRIISTVPGDVNGDVATRISTQNRRDLGETFGTRKSQKAIKSYERGQIEMHHLSSVAVHLASAIDVKADTMQTTADVERESDKNRNIPPFDQETLDVAEIYNVNELIPPSVYETIPSAALMVYKKKDFITMRQQGDALYLPYVMTRMEPSIINKNEKKVKCLLFMQYMLAMRNMSPSDLNRRGALSSVGVPDEAERHLLDLFTEVHTNEQSGTGSKKRRMSPMLKDKLTAYICALALHIDEFLADPSQLAVDLKVANTKMISGFKSIGCVVESQNVGGIIIKKMRLTAPLKFPKPPKMMKRK